MQEISGKVSLLMVRLFERNELQPTIPGRKSLCSNGQRIVSLFIALYITCPPLARSEDAPGLINTYSVHISGEALNYQEVEPDTETTSAAEVINKLIDFNIAQEYDSTIIGFKGAVPYHPGIDNERWDVANITKYQTNDLKYDWLRIDTYIGTRYNPENSGAPGIWYAGLRYSKAEQKRTNLVLRGTPQPPAVITEEIKSYHLIVGYKTQAALIEAPAEWRDQTVASLTWNYQMEYGFPIYNRAVNSTISDVIWKDRVGYTAEIRTGFSYRLDWSLSFDAEIYGGRMYWKGGGWETSYDTGSPSPVKWPENKTDYLGGTIGFTLTF